MMKPWFEELHTKDTHVICYESHIEEVILKGRSYKDLDSPTLVASF